MKTLLELEPADCRWPIGKPEHHEDGHQRFCGCRRRPATPYCPRHCEVAYVPTAPQKPASETDTSFREAA